MTNADNAIAFQESIRPKVKLFKTAKGSVYTYDEEGKTTRFKTATQEQMHRQDITVFVNLTPDEDQAFLRAYRHPHEEDKNSKVYVLERQPDDTPKIIWDIREVNDSENIYLGIVQNGEVTLNKKASLTPVIGSLVFDTRRYQREDDQWVIERHLGNEIVEIQ